MFKNYYLRNRFIFSLLTIISLTSYCKKKKTATYQDKIVADNLDTIKINTVRYWELENHDVCSAEIPFPNDSSASIELDLNKDKINDFRFELTHNKYIPTSYCGHCSVFTYKITIQGLHTSDSIASNMSIANYFGYLDKINHTNTWSNTAILMMYNTCNLVHFKIENEYIGIKHNNQVGWIKIKAAPNNGLLIQNFALNLTETNNILAGQTN